MNLPFLCYNKRVNLRKKKKKIKILKIEFTEKDQVYAIDG